MLHDIAKEFDQQKIKFLVKEKIQQFPTINAAHGLAGAIFVCNELNIKNKQIFNAIANHVIPSEKCSKLSMIIYCADKLDPNKSKLRIEQKIELTKLAKRDIKKAYLVIKNIFRNNFF
jgi:predicted HD superfamily hydrolase involved in NAD metabolism